MSFIRSLWNKISNLPFSTLTRIFEFLALIAIALFAWYYLQSSKEEKVTVMPIEKAETVEGVQEASSKANVSMSNMQTKEVVTQIKEIRTTEQVPVYVVQSKGATVKEDTKKAQEDAKADFSIVTGKDSDEVATLDEIPSDAKVELNQYNVQAYKPVIRQIEVGKSLDETKSSMVGFTVSKKISKDGQYLGVGFDHIWNDSDRIEMVKVVYSW